MSSNNKAVLIIDAVRTASYNGKHNHSDKVREQYQRLLVSLQEAHQHQGKDTISIAIKCLERISQCNEQSNPIHMASIASECLMHMNDMNRELYER